MKALLLASGVVLSACVAVWCRPGDRSGPIALHLGWYGLAFTAYLAALWASRGLSTRGLRLALGAGVAWRVALVVAAPPLVPDVDRSVWDGRIQGHGGNPYSWADRPAAARWDGLRDDVWRRIRGKDETALELPLWQIAARGVVALHDSIPAMKAFLVACELLTLWLLAVLLRRRELPEERLLILAWSPLALVEVAGSGHNQPLGLLLLVASLLALEAGRPLLSALAATLGFQAALLPGLLAVAWGYRYKLRHLAVALLTAPLLALPYVGAGSSLWRSLGPPPAAWRFNETLFAALAAFLGQREAVLAVALVLASLAAYASWTHTEAVEGALIVTMWALLLAPSVPPWQALWLLPLLVLQDWPPGLLFTGTVPLAYLVYPGGPAVAWHPGFDPRLLEYGSCVALGVWLWVAGRRR